MSRKKTRRKFYDTSISGIAMAISGACITPQSDLNKLRGRELGAIEDFAKGRATRNEFRDICDMLNVAQVMATKMNIGPEAIPVCELADRELQAAKARFDETGKLGLSGVGLNAVREVFAYHDAQRQAVDRSTYERAIKKTMDMIRSRHPSLKVLA
jgi:hypothetical protein